MKTYLCKLCNKEYIQSFMRQKTSHGKTYFYYCKECSKKITKDDTEYIHRSNNYQKNKLYFKIKRGLANSEDIKKRNSINLSR